MSTANDPATPATIAFLGLGSMGRPMAENLAASGSLVRLWNRTAERAAGINGTTVCPTAIEAVHGASVVITMLADDHAVEQVLLGPRGVLAAMAPGTLHIACSTASVALTARLAELHGTAGQRFVAAPVFGRPDAAASAALWIVLGGAPDDRTRAAEVLRPIGRIGLEVDGAAQASLVKLSGNFMIASAIEMLGEVTALTERGGLDPEQVINFFANSLFAAPVFRNYGPKVARREWSPVGFALPLGLKDVRLVLAAAEANAVPMPIASLLRDRLLAALAHGDGDKDWTALAAVARRDAGLPDGR